MPNASPRISRIALPSGVLDQFARQIADDLKVAIAEALLGIARTPQPVLDQAARVVVEHVRGRRTGLPRPRLISRRIGLASRDVVEHARRYALARTSPAAGILQSRSNAQLAGHYQWAQRALSASHLRSVHDGFPGAAMSDFHDRPPAAAAAPSFTKVSFRVWRVDCEDETGLEALGGESGHDEIRMAATSVDARGRVEKVPSFKVKDFEHDGDFRFYPDSKVIKTFPIDAALAFPQINVVHLHLAESDQGGFGDFLHEFYEAIKGYVVSVLVNAGISVGAEVGAALGSIGGPIGSVVGAVVGAALGLLIGWLVESLEDDIFETQASAIQLPSTSDSFAGSDRSPVFALTYAGHDGKYVVHCDWHLSAA